MTRDLLVAEPREQQAEAACLRRVRRGRQAELDAATRLRRVKRASQVTADRRELGHGR